MTAFGWGAGGYDGRTLAHNVRAARTHAGLSLDELSRRAKVSKGALVELEKAQGNPTFATPVRLADTLGISISAPMEGRLARGIGAALAQHPAAGLRLQGGHRPAAGLPAPGTFRQRRRSAGRRPRRLLHRPPFGAH
ncbi:helix-turn-helix domain-containing protein, partial [Streptomyces flavofungini]|uniref:helix-turn-helix domain-containing protein n=1 Tax=Streptomyces flavofungini TaxID=68200 RepID=UPI0034DF6851